jgi:hypothetical protein
MTRRYGTLGPLLRRVGYDVIPVKAGDKAPAIPAWQHVLSLEQTLKYAANGHANNSVGLLASRFPGVDIDVTDPACADAIAACAESTLGPAPVRYGGVSPKRLLMYFTLAPFAKVKVYLSGPNGDRGPDGKQYAVEVLGAGQQNVIYGQHPSGTEYNWPADDGPETHNVWELTPITLDDVQRFITSLASCLPQGWSVVSGSADASSGAGAVSTLTAFENYHAPLEGWTIERTIDEVLVHLDPDMAHDDWVRVGMAMHHQGAGDHEWLSAWEDWSSNSSKFIDGVCETRWKSFSQQRGQGRGALTLATLIKQVRPTVQAAVQAAARSVMAELLDLVDSTTRAQDLETVVAARAAKTAGLSNTDRATLASRIQAKARDLGVRLQIGEVRKWLVNKSYGGFPHITEEGYPLSTLDNLIVLLARLEIVVRYNVIKKAIEILIPGHSSSRDNRDNSSMAVLTSECEKHRMSPRHLNAFILKLADQNLYNPVMTWIESKPWDGVSRLQEFYSTVQSDSPLKELFIRKWLLQCVAAAFSTDVLATQGVLTFAGPQGIGKTTWFTRLAPKELDVILIGHTLDTKSKDSVCLAVSHWIVELGELDATMRKSDIAALKAFITQIVDKLRRPYDAKESQFGRRTSFCGSVNEFDFLYDATGNRRFWTVPVTAFELNDTLDMQQIWAEVYALFLAGENFALNQEEMVVLSTHNEDFTVVDPVEERIAGFFDWSSDQGNWEWITATEALMRAGIREPTKSQAISAGRALSKLNADQRRKSHGRILHAVPGQEFLGRG